MRLRVTVFVVVVVCVCVCVSLCVCVTVCVYNVHFRGTRSILRTSLVSRLSPLCDHLSEGDSLGMRLP